MSQPDYRGARGSNAGDDFHELWVLREALALLDPETTLFGLTVEGLTTKDQSGVKSDTWDGVDCALYYEGNSAETAKQIEIAQFKYSSSSPKKKWTIARLTSSTVKTGNNSVLRRMGTVFSSLKKKRNNSHEGLRARLISNQPMDEEVVSLIKDVSNGKTLTGPDLSKYKSLQTASGLNRTDFSQLASILDLSQTGSRFMLQEEILKTISGWIDSDARPLQDVLLRFVRKMMMPEGNGEWINSNSILAQLGFAHTGALFPCPPQLASNGFLVHRKVSSEVVEMFKNGSTHICVHGTGGSGKTTVLREISRLLPTGSRAGKASDGTVPPPALIFLNVLRSFLPILAAAAANSSPSNLAACPKDFQNLSFSPKLKILL